MKLFWALLYLLCGGMARAADLTQFGYDQRPGSVLSFDAEFRDSTGRKMTLSQAADGLPLILALVYFHCPNLCGVVRSDLFYALSGSGLVAGRDYALVALSIDPSEGPAAAASAKAQDLARFPLRGAPANWHFLTGSSPKIQAVTGAVGFRDRFDPDIDQFLHPAGVVFVTPGGTVSSYLLGVGYNPGDVRLAIDRAANGNVVKAAEPVLLLCFHYDPSTGRYSLEILKLLRLGAVLTVITIAGTIALALRREPRT